MRRRAAWKLLFALVSTACSNAGDPSPDSLPPPAGKAEVAKVHGDHDANEP